MKPLWENFDAGRVGLDRVRSIVTLDGKRFTAGVAGIVSFVSNHEGRLVGDPGFDVELWTEKGLFAIIAQEFVGMVIFKEEK